MKLSAGNRLSVLLLLIGCLWSVSGWAELSATVDRREIALGETLRLTLLGDAGEQPAEVDLSALNRDWEILSRSSATNARFINGQNQVTRTLEMELAPRREGTLAIPALVEGGRSTTPLSIRVNPEPVLSPGDELVIFEASVDQSSVYVQAELLLTITLQQAINLDGGEISALDIPDAVMEALERRSFQRRVGNRTWLVTELRYAIYPQKSGRLLIPAVEFSAREVQPGRSLLGARLGRRIRLASEALSIDVKSVPSEFPGSVWLPARTLSLEETWSLDPASLAEGDSSTRTLTLIAEGLQGSQLPPLSSVQDTDTPPELRFYPDQESIDQSELPRGLQGRRIQSEALVARSAGSWVLPEITVPWWNTRTDSLEYARIAARPVTVAALTPTTVGSISPEPLQSDKVVAAPPWWIALSAGGWLLSLLMGVLLWRSRGRGQLAETSSASPLSEASLRQQLVRLRQATEGADPGAIRACLLGWASTHFHRPVRSLDELCRLASDPLRTAILRLDRAVYGRGEPDWRPSEVFEAVRQEPAATAPADSDTVLALYPAH